MERFKVRTQVKFTLWLVCLLFLYGCTGHYCCNVGQTARNISAIAHHTSQEAHQTRNNLKNLASFFVEDTATSPSRLKNFGSILTRETSRQWRTTPQNLAIVGNFTAKSVVEFPDKVRTTTYAVKNEVGRQVLSLSETMEILVPVILNFGHLSEFVEGYFLPELARQWETTGYLAQQFPEAVASHWTASIQNFHNTVAIFARVTAEQWQQTPDNFTTIFLFIISQPPPDVEFFTSEFVRQIYATRENFAFLATFLPQESIRQSNNFAETATILYQGVSYENAQIGLGNFFDFVDGQIQESWQELPEDLKFVGELLCPPDE